MVSQAVAQLKKEPHRKHTYDQTTDVADEPLRDLDSAA